MMVNYREFVTGSGRRVFGGRDAESNDELVWDAKGGDVLLHTSAPGSPFVNVGEGASKKDLKEAGVFCAKFSQDWRDGKRDVVVNVFLRRDMKKTPKMKAGLWRVGKSKDIRIKAGEILAFEHKLRAEISSGIRDLD